MGSLKVTVSVMQFLIFSSLLVAAHAQLVAYPNGAVAPFDPNNAAATKEHFAALAEAGSIVNPYTTHAQDLAVPVVVPAAGLYYGKRSADPQVVGADGLVTYPNGAVAPFNPTWLLLLPSTTLPRPPTAPTFPWPELPMSTLPQLWSTDVRSARLTPSFWLEPTLTTTHTPTPPWLSPPSLPIPMAPLSPWSPRMS